MQAVEPSSVACAFGHTVDLPALLSKCTHERTCHNANHHDPPSVEVVLGRFRSGRLSVRLAVGRSACLDGRKWSGQVHPDEILAGVYRKDSGDISLDGRAV